MMSMNYYCEKCNYNCNKTSNWNKHINTKKHKLEKIEANFTCTTCKYNCNNSYDMDRHKLSSKHKTLVTDDKDPNYMDIIKQLLTQNNELKNFIIEQAQDYKKETQDYKKETTNILNRVIEQANEHKKDTVEIITKVIEQTKPTTTNNTTTNSNNKAFNINVFLNETCKDAINFSDFIKNIEVTREDLENNAQLGFVNGISKILLDNLRELSITERPIHCTDLKREIMYVKDDNKWTKDENKSKMSSAILMLSQKSARTLLDWKKVNPDYKNHDSDFSNRCIVIQRHSMAGYDRDTYYPKVIKAVAREIMVDK
jgi:hypothetical protein